ncbi:ankyrin and het domain protein [Colletotrichum musicola]|uniref:Ankyrin and het domain protein n=1 Tax=Colletotrichum musicola TaxID=2175873 RepID=A0A8H6K0M2_9PEZI|nr:ankyrin and het domain protein [Colletotrichum musicola]
MRKNLPIRRLTALASAVGTDAFRLVKIRQEDDSHQAIITSSDAAPRIDLQIETFPFDQRPEYYALSYTWGPADRETEETDEIIQIAVNGDEFFVRPNLHDALLQLRSSYSGRWFWIDAVCINQDDLAERSTQVATMNVIYTNATRTVAWIGKQGPGFGRAVEIIEDFVTMTEETLAPTSFADFVKKPDPGLLEAAGYPALTLEDWKALQDHFLEVSTIALNVSGCYHRGLFEFSAASYHVWGVMGAAFICSIKAVTQTPFWPEPHVAEQILLDLMMKMKRFDCTDVRDRFFAVFGILKHAAATHDFEISTFSVDHRASAEDVFCALAGNIIMGTGRLELMRWTGKTRSQLQGLPSWVPDWSIPTASLSKSLLVRSRDASKSTEMADNGIEVRDGKLRCRGLRIAAITELIDDRGSTSHYWPPMQRLLLILDRLEKSAAERAELIAQDDPNSLAGFSEEVGHIAATDDSGLFPSLGDVVERRRLMARVGLNATSDYSDWPLPSDEEGKQLIQDWRDKQRKWLLEMAVSMVDRQCTFLEGGYLANVLKGADEGDEIWILQGASVPFVLRKGENRGEWVNIGNAYVHGIMDGEAITDDTVWEDICIV